MQTPREIYAAYKIMPALQLHQLRVAAVGKLICGDFTQHIEKNDVILACLFHDMGNIIKFDLGRFPEFLEPQGLQYWQQVKDEYTRKYGTEQHSATEQIAREIGLPQAALGILGATGFSRIAEVAAGNSMETKIVQYADLRIGPFGVLSLDERLDDLSVRYAGKKDGPYNDARRGSKVMERQVFAQATIKPENITDAAVAPLIEELWEYPLA